MRITYSDGVFEELVNLSAFIAQGSEPAANDFLNACDAAFKLLAEQPLIGTHKHFDNSDLAEVRMWRVKGFSSYLIFYIPTKDGIYVLHVIHSAQDYNQVFEDE